MPITKDGYDGTFIAALVRADPCASGRTDEAVGMIERLLVTPGPVMAFYEASITLTELRTRWQWAPLREHPRVQKCSPLPSRRLSTKRFVIPNDCRAGMLTR